MTRHAEQVDVLFCPTKPSAGLVPRWQEGRSREGAGWDFKEKHSPGQHTGEGWVPPRNRERKGEQSGKGLVGGFTESQPRLEPASVHVVDNADLSAGI